VVVGANTVAGSVAVNNGTPGPTTVKANNIFGSLGCSGNNPAPTNAGQANTASAGKTGQCAGL
jgi:hexosaminidase